MQQQQVRKQTRRRPVEPAQDEQVSPPGATSRGEDQTVDVLAAIDAALARQ